MILQDTKISDNIQDIQGPLTAATQAHPSIFITPKIFTMAEKTYQPHINRQQSIFVPVLLNILLLMKCSEKYVFYLFFFPLNSVQASFRVLNWKTLHIALHNWSFSRNPKFLLVRLKILYPSFISLPMHD